VVRVIGLKKSKIRIELEVVSREVRMVLYVSPMKADIDGERERCAASVEERRE